MIDGLIGGNAADLRRFGNLIAQCRRDARRIIADGGANKPYRLGLIGERLIAAFDDIDTGATLEQRLMVIGANAADARDVKPGKDSMLHLLWAHSLEWSAMRQREEGNEWERAPLYWAVSAVMLDLMKTNEAQPSGDAAFRHTFGAIFEKLATGGNRD